MVVVHGSPQMQEPVNSYNVNVDVVVRLMQRLCKDNRLYLNSNAATS